MNTDIRRLQSHEVNNLVDLISVFKRSFDMPSFRQPAPDYLRTLLANGDFVAVTASVDGKIIAGLTAYVLPQYYSERPLAYLYDLAVLPAYLRKGIGRRLLEFTHDLCRQMGCEELFVQADQDDRHALDFYRSTRPSRDEPVVHFSYAL